MVLGLLLGCLKPAPPVPGDGVTLNVATVMAPLTGAISAAPPKFEMGLVVPLSSRGAIPAFVTGPDELTLLARYPDSAQRLDALAQTQVGAVLLVETAPSFYSELNGQYRWTVGVRLSLAEGDDDPLYATFDVPVFLRYHHEREAEAVVAATPVVSRRAAQLVDTWMAGRE